MALVCCKLSVSCILRYSVDGSTVAGNPVTVCSVPLYTHVKFWRVEKSILKVTLTHSPKTLSLPVYTLSAPSLDLEFPPIILISVSFCSYPLNLPYVYEFPPSLDLIVLFYQYLIDQE